VGILVICGRNVSKIKPNFLKPSNIIFVNLVSSPSKGERLYDTYLRNRIGEKYTEHFLIEFIRRLLNLKEPRRDQELIDEARILADYLSVCKVSSLLLKDGELRSYV
jgi:hypothetical protein